MDTEELEEACCHIQVEHGSHNPDPAPHGNKGNNWDSGDPGNEAADKLAVKGSK
jgi:hypothetical protein